MAMDLRGHGESSVGWEDYTFGVDEEVGSLEGVGEAVGPPLLDVARLLRSRLA